MEENNRIKWVDTVRGICIFSLLLCHQTIENNIILLYGTFFMPLFFFVSGYLYKYKGLDSIKKIIKGLLLPYIIFSYVTSCISPEMLRQITADTWLSYLWHTTQRMLLGRTYWFIACLIVVQILYTFICFTIDKWKYKDVFKLIIAICAILSIFVIRREYSGFMVWNIDTACIAIGYFGFGDLFKKVNIKNLKINYRLRIFSIVLLFVYIILALNFEWKVDYYFDMHINRYDNPMLCLALSIFSCATIILLSITNNCGTYIEKLGKNTLVIYCLHSLWGIGIASKLFDFINVDKWIHNNILQLFLVALLASYILLIIANFINKYMPFMLGKKYNYSK